MIEPIRPLLPVVALTLLAACSGSDGTSSPSPTDQPTTTSQEPAKPPPTTQPPNTAPPSTQPPGSQPPGSQPLPPASGGAFTQGTGFNSIVRTIVMAEDGTNDLYVGGDFTTYNGQPANHLIRLRPDGTVAQTFGRGFDQLVLAIALASDGSNALYVGGRFTQFDGQPAPQLIRVTSNGLRDATFQTGNLGFEFWTLAVSEDGSRDVYVAGNVVEGNPVTNPRGSVNGRIVRFNSDGTPDPMFSTGTGFPGAPDGSGATVASIAVPPGGSKLYVGGSMFTYNGQPVNSLVRLNPDGTLDSTFMNGTGVPPSPSIQIVELVTPAADGSGDIYAGGRISVYDGTPVSFGSIRVHENGALDTIYRPAVELLTFAIAPIPDASGDVMVSGYDRASNGSSSSLLLRFGRNGTVVSSFIQPTLNEVVLTIVPVQDGTNDLYIGGVFTTYNGVPVNHIARIHAGGSLASVVD